MLAAAGCWLLAAAAAAGIILLLHTDRQRPAGEIDC
jgi:hypothetical protein